MNMSIEHFKTIHQAWDISIMPIHRENVYSLTICQPIMIKQKY